jgi:hypothetical protein
MVLDNVPVRYRTELRPIHGENEYRHFGEYHYYLRERDMENSSDKQVDEMKDSEPVDQPTEPQADQPADESSEGIPVGEETHGNRLEERVENRASKKQETREVAKSIGGTEAHHDPRNESPDTGPAPLDRY